jgi:glycosyltransferase involved in cell wall biosynthesis
MKQTLSKLLKQEQFSFRGIFVSTYIPRRCGIATYTKDLSNGINILNPTALSEIMAIDDDNEPVDYPWEVKFRIRKEREQDYLDAARYINKSSADYICLQHEYGIFGGTCGSYILSMVRHLQKPLITTFHTTLENPSSEQLYILRKIAQYSKACVVMIDEAASRLKTIYDVPEEKIVIIPHGVPDIPFSPSDLFKKNVDFAKNDFLIGSINLIAPNKGLEYVIEALPELIKINPNVKFVMIGQTHPIVKIKNGEQYRKSLHELIKKRNLQEHFIEIDQYVSLEDLISYLKALDIYVTPYTGLNQTSSGTLAYAIGAGKVCVSTPYIYAREVLANGRGILVEPKSSTSIVKEVGRVLQDKKYKAEIERKAYQFGRRMIWPHVALDYLNMVKYVLENKS